MMKSFTVYVLITSTISLWKISQKVLFKTYTFFFKVINHRDMVVAWFKVIMSDEPIAPVHLARLAIANNKHQAPSC